MKNYRNEEQISSCQKSGMGKGAREGLPIRGKHKRFLW